MKLERVEIRNFRSLKDVTITLEPRCRALIGINESGKSNILKALALLDSDRKFQSDDIRDFSPNEDTDQPAYVRFIYSLDKSDRIACLESLASRFYSAAKSQPIVRQKDRLMTLAEFVAEKKEALRIVDLKQKQRWLATWSIPDDYTIVDGWLEPAEGVTLDSGIFLSDGTVETAGNIDAIHESLLRSESQNLTPLTIESLCEIVRKAIATLVEEGEPDCLYWTYSDSQLMPGQIAVDSFAANPQSCEPLRQMFRLAGYEHPQKAILEARSRQNGMRNLLNRVAEKATEHMRNVWKDYRGISIELHPNGPHIDASIKDEFNLYNFERRSDGFKRFASFLLLVSAKAKNNELENTLYLHDEPDIGLHPSGARHLRDELIKIAKNNWVVFSTHSIFMVDRERIDRHLVIKKIEEATTVSEPDAAAIRDEEVLYNALGYSVFETLQDKNIIFEGWRDKQLFQVALSGNTARCKRLKTAFKSIGRCHAKGVKDVERITPLLQLANRAWMVVSDSDRMAVEYQGKYKGSGPWVRYDELLQGQSASTGEDFIKPDAFKPVLSAFQKTHAALSHFDITQLENAPSRLDVVQRWLKRGGFDGEPLRQSLDKIKGELCERLKPSHIEDKYFDLCEALLAKLKTVRAEN
jgi:energy-coupling factor transporter ATP-binding protein EcfA2